MTPRSRIAAKNWKQGLEPEIFDEWPACEVYAVGETLRPDTIERWQAAGGEVFSGRMIALKTDPVWARFSKYGRPHPPYDNFSHHLVVRDIGREEATRLGLLDREQETVKARTNSAVYAATPQSSGSSSIVVGMLGVLVVVIVVILLIRRS